MQREFRINEEIAASNVVAVEILSAAREAQRFVRNDKTREHFNAVILEFSQSFAVLYESFEPFIALDSFEKFQQQFDAALARFKEQYLLDVARPRKYCDNVYEDYVELQHMKEYKSGFPAFKRLFGRLHAVYDKWISNDCYLGLSIDGAIKQQNLLLTAIAEQKSKDEEEAWEVFATAFADFQPLIGLCRQLHEQILRHCQVTDIQEAAG